LEKVREDRASGKLSLRQLARKFGISIWSAQQAISGMDLAVLKPTVSLRRQMLSFGLAVTTT
jgi:transcriptional regulator with XRE-family HTH domain